MEKKKRPTYLSAKSAVVIFRTKEPSPLDPGKWISPLSCIGELWGLSWDVMSHHSFFKWIPQFLSYRKKISTLLEAIYHYNHPLPACQVFDTCRMFQFQEFEAPLQLQPFFSLKTIANRNTFCTQELGEFPRLSWHQPLGQTPQHLGFLNSLLGFESCPAGLLQDVSQQTADHHGAEENHPTSKSHHGNAFFQRWKKNDEGLEKKQMFSWKHIGNIYQISDFNYDLGKHHLNVRYETL